MTTVNYRDQLPKKRLLVIGDFKAPPLLETNNLQQPLSESNPLAFDIYDDPLRRHTFEVYHLVTDIKTRKYLQIYVELLMDITDAIVYILPDGSASQPGGGTFQIKQWLKMIPSACQTKIIFVSYEQTFHGQASLLQKIKECFMKDSQLFKCVVFPSRLTGMSCVEKVVEIVEADEGVPLSCYIREVTPIGWVKKLLSRKVKDTIVKRHLPETEESIV